MMKARAQRRKINIGSQRRIVEYRHKKDFIYGISCLGLKLLNLHLTYKKDFIYKVNCLGPKSLNLHLTFIF